MMNFMRDVQEKSLLSAEEQLRINNEIKYFYDTDLVPEDYYIQRETQMLALANENIAGKYIAPMDAVLSSTTLPDIEKTSLIIYLLLTDDASAFFKVNGNSTSLFKRAAVLGFDKKWPPGIEFACLLKLLASKNDDVSFAIKAMLSSPDDAEYARLREAFIEYYVSGMPPIVKKPGKPFEKGDKDYTWMVALWTMVTEPDYMHLGISYLAALSKYPERLIAFAQWISDLGHRNTAFSMTRDMNIYSEGSYGANVDSTNRINKAQVSLRIICWASIQEAHSRSERLAKRDEALGDLWYLIDSKNDPKDVELIVNEITYARLVGISTVDIAVALCTAFENDVSIPLSTLVALSKETELPIRSYFDIALWRDKHNHARQLVAAIAVGMTISDVFKSKNLPAQFSAEAAGILTGILRNNLSNLSSDDLCAFLTRVNEKSFPEKCFKDLKLKDNDAFLTRCRDDITTLFDVVIEHPSLIPLIFKDGTEPEKKLIEDTDENHLPRVSNLMRRDEYPLRRVVQTYSILNDFSKRKMFHRDSTVYKKIASNLDDNYFESFSKDGKSQKSLLKMCVENNMFQDLHNKKQGTSKKLFLFFKAGVDAELFNPKELITVFGSKKDMNDIVRYCKERINPVLEQQIENTMLHKVEEVPVVHPEPVSNNNNTSSSSSNIQVKKTKPNNAAKPRLVPVVPLVIFSNSCMLSMSYRKPLPVVMAWPVQSVEAQAAMLEASAKVIRQEEFYRRIEDIFTPTGSDHILFKTPKSK